jgi:hypothetical protein
VQGRHRRYCGFVINILIPYSVLFQSSILRSLLPHVGVPYLSLDLYLASSDSLSPGASKVNNESRGKGALPIKDCPRPKPDRINGCIEEAFIDGMSSVLKFMATLHQ